MQKYKDGKDVFNQNLDRIKRDREVITWENLEVGDVFLDPFGYQYPIVKMDKPVIYLEFIDEVKMLTISMVQSRKWRIQQPAKPSKTTLKLTLKEVAEKFGVDEVKIVKTK